ncbi:MAG: phosphatidylserine/phosphatidylglycerophosphate/cardiolipin synthase family protein [Alphaproteobacteria bacterium]
MVKSLKNYLFTILFFTLVSCSTVPNSINDSVVKEKTTIVPATLPKVSYDTTIAQIYKKELTENPELSGATLINNGVEAFLARAAYAQLATKTIEVQTYIYDNDPTSRILLYELLRAAERGVKVKILVDDNGMDSDMSDIMILDFHKNIEVKVFNTFKYREHIVRYPQFLFDFNRLNSRMHNKLFVVDGVSVIVGGRNLAQNYFDSDKNTNFSDTDVVFLGKIAREAQESFYKYWNYHLAIPAYLFPDRKNLDVAKKEFEDLQNSHTKEFEYYKGIMDYIVSNFKEKKTYFEWGKGTIIADPPEKIDIPKKEKLKSVSPILKALKVLWNNTKKNIYISSAYFVPGKLGTERLIEEVNKGVDITVITNSLSSTDASAVYSAWERYRKDLLKAGVNIYEFMNKGLKLKGKQISSFASLHSKTMVIDEKLSWIGSFNLDPRSAMLNSEIVAVFESEPFAKQLIKKMEEDMKDSWKLELLKGKTVWIGHNEENDKETIEYKAPNTTLWKRFTNKILKIVPESLI